MRALLVEVDRERVGRIARPGDLDVGVALARLCRKRRPPTVETIRGRSSRLAADPS